MLIVVEMKFIAPRTDEGTPAKCKEKIARNAQWYKHDRVKINQLDAQVILSIFRQHLHGSGVSRPIIRRYNRMYITIGTYYSEKRIV
jgi:hypothetical protein